MYDNQVVMHIASNPAFYERPKLIVRVDLYRICEDWITIRRYFHKILEWRLCNKLDMIHIYAPT